MTAVIKQIFYWEFHAPSLLYLPSDKPAIVCWQRWVFPITGNRVAEDEETVLEHARHGVGRDAEYGDCLFESWVLK
jgi:hypothetical protein